MMRKIFRIRGLWALLALGALVVTTGCADLNDNPAEGPAMDVDLAGMQEQLGFTESTTADGTRIVSPPESLATEAVETLVIGAVVVNQQSTPYTADTMTSSAQDRMETDVLNSANFFAVVDLPTSAETVAFNLPPTSAGDWQVMAAGLRVNIDVLGELEDEGDAVIYYGFTDGFLSVSTAEKGVDLLMRRACLGDEPTFGCGQFTDDGATVLTGAVELQDVLIKRSSETSYTSFAGALPTVSESVPVLNQVISFTLDFSTLLEQNSFPISIRSDELITIGEGTTVSTTLEWAVETGMQLLLSELSPAPASGDTLKIVTTHQEAWAEGECTEFTYSDVGETAINDPESLTAEEQAWISECLQVYTTVLESNVDQFSYSTPPIVTN